jgi:hypothetical protein
VRLQVSKSRGQRSTENDTNDQIENPTCNCLCLHTDGHTQTAVVQLLQLETLNFQNGGRPCIECGRLSNILLDPWIHHEIQPCPGPLCAIPRCPPPDADAFAFIFIPYPHGCMATGGHGLPKVSLGPAMLYPSTHCGWATSETAGVAHPQGCRPAAVFHPFGHSMTCAFALPYPYLTLVSSAFIFTQIIFFTQMIFLFLFPLCSQLQHAGIGRQQMSSSGVSLSFT